MSAQNATASQTGLLAGLINRKQLAAELGRSERSIMVYEAEGLPVIRRGRLRFYDVSKVRAWLEGKPLNMPKRRRDHAA